MDQIASIKKNSNDFLSKNQLKYDLFIMLKNRLVSLSKESYNDIINFIEDNKSIFFKDHSNAALFINNIVLTSEYNFKRFELFLDIIINFLTDIKRVKITDEEIMSSCLRFPNAINYLFSKKVISIQTIVNFSFFEIKIFINFLPEIEEYDLEFANKQQKLLIDELSNQSNKNFYEFVKKSRQNHLKYRSLNYHPSPLHKSIREDDIETFQSLLSLNNYGVNYQIIHSEYERSRTENENLSLIQIAALYGSIKIFKFLWMQQEISFDDNLIDYAYFGHNFEIIHLCEKKCNSDKIFIQSIRMNRNDLLDYCIENFGNKIIEKDIDLKKALEQNFVDDEDSFYNCLNSECLYEAAFSYNFEILKSCLPKIVFIENCFLKNLQHKREDSFLCNTYFDLDLFKFLYNQSDSNIDKKDCDCYINTLFSSALNNANDAFKFMFLDLKDYLNNSFIEIMEVVLEFNHDMANFLFDTANPEIYNTYFTLAARYFDEKLVLKMLKLYEKELVPSIDLVDFFVYQLNLNLSNKMIVSLVDEMTKFISNDLMIIMQNSFKKYKNNFISSYIHSKYKDEK